MAANEYHFIDRWRVKGTIEEVSAVIGAKGTDLPRWWPSTYSDAEEIEAGEESGLGNVFRIRGRGWLPYSLKLEFSVIEVDRPHGFTLGVSGDLDGVGEWRFRQDGEMVDVTFDWRVRVNKPGVRELSPLLKPLFRSNHHYTMVKGEQSLELELLRRGTPEDERLELPVPPGPAKAPITGIITAGLAVGALLVAAGMRSRSRSSTTRSERHSAL